MTSSYSVVSGPGPGTYYLTVSGTGGWGSAQGPLTATVTEDTGVALGQPYYWND